MPTAAQVSDIFGFKVKGFDTATTDPSDVGSIDGVQPKRCAPVLSLLYTGATADAGELVSKEYASAKYLAFPSVSLSEQEASLDDLQALLDKCDTVKDVYPSGAVFLQLDDQYKKAQVRSTSRPRPDVLLVDAVLSQMTYNPQDPGSCDSNWTDNAGRQMCPLEYTQSGLFAFQQVGGTLVEVEALGITRINGGKRSPKLPTSEQVLALLDLTASNVQTVPIDE
jgi:hypothetical protein